MGLLGWIQRSCNSKARLDGKVAIITGCNTGIGLETAKEFARRGCRVIMACRDLEKAGKAADKIIKAGREAREKANRKTGGVIDSESKEVGEVRPQVEVHYLDLSSLKSVRSFAEKIIKAEPQIDLLINNAGVMACPKNVTEDGFEWQFGVNHLGHFLLTLLLLPNICKQPGARIVILSSLAHIWGDFDFDDLNYEKASYSPIGAYARSKLANVLFCRELAKRLEGTDVHTYSVHPGLVATEMSRHFSTTVIPGLTWICNNIGPYLGQNAVQGCQTTLHCAINEKTAKDTGLYYSNCAVTTPSVKARNPETAQRLWDESLILVGLKEDPTLEFLKQRSGE